MNISVMWSAYARSPPLRHIRQDGQVGQGKLRRSAHLQGARCSQLLVPPASTIGVLVRENPPLNVHLWPFFSAFCQMKEPEPRRAVRCALQ